ncbi:ATP-binding protein [Pedobacter sp. SAFR-022]|uniref:ATP-binding protein n=1 Tax=Pedobacter sp. SAFR-022 TaxID=3436861 RepID=UPI003F7D1099
MKEQQPETDYKNKFEECNGRFEGVFDHTSAASKIINSDLEILKVNRALVELLGFSEAEIVGTKIMDYACKDVVHHWEDLQDAMWKHGKPYFKLDACLVRKDGSLAWIHVTTVLFQQDQEYFAYTVLDDFSYQKNLEETEKRLSMALENSRMAVWELDLEDGSIMHTTGFKQLFGIQEPVKAWNRERLLRQFLKEDGERLREVLANINKESTIDFQGRIRTLDGVVRWVYLQGKPSLEHGRQPTKILGTITDITKEKLAERDKDDFISIASHELRTPITALKASLQLLDTMKQGQSPKAASLITQANKSMHKITHLIDDLLNVNNLKEGQLRLKKTRFRIGSAVDDCCLHVAAEGIFEIITSGDLDQEVEADSERIQQVVINLVNNAMKYAHGTGKIWINIAKVDGDVKVSVTDQGPGIEEDKLPHLFDRFYRADISSGQYSGLGLGLYIASEIVRRHKGQIGVDSSPGKGSTFWFTLPLDA